MGPFKIDNFRFYNTTYISSLKNDVDGLLALELTYHAFGVTSSEGIPWTIKNGVYNTPDDVPELDAGGNPTGRGVGAGGYFLVKFGEGSQLDVPSVMVTTDN